MKSRMFRISLVVVALGAVWVGTQTSRAGYETAPYTVVRSDGRIEVRDYPALTVVETAMARADGGDGSFMRLFRFIGGANEDQEKIAMTTPVFMSGGSTNATMAFVMPAAMKTADVPKPSDAAVAVRELPAGRFAVLRFSGRQSAANEAAALKRLQAWMEAQKLPALSPPIYAYFDPPWTLSFLRRNEVMVLTREPAEAEAAGPEARP